MYAFKRTLSRTGARKTRIEPFETVPMQHCRAVIDAKQIEIDQAVNGAAM